MISSSVAFDSCQKLSWLIGISNRHIYEEPRHTQLRLHLVAHGRNHVGNRNLKIAIGVTLSLVGRDKHATLGEIKIVAQSFRAKRSLLVDNDILRTQGGEQLDSALRAGK